MIKKLTLTLFLMTCSFFVQASAQTVVSAASDEKQAAIKELLAVMNAQIKPSDLMAMMSAQIDKTAELTVKSMLAGDVNLTPADKKMLEDILLNGENSPIKSLQKKLFEKIDFDALIEEMTISIYDKHFTLEEIKDVTAFYKSTTGQKLLKTTPAIFADTMQTMAEKIYPKIMEVIKESEEGMKREIEVKIKEQKSKSKNKATE